MKAKASKSEKFYIVYFNTITQYDITNKGYYVGYKDKLEDNYSDNYVFAKRYKTLAPALNRAYLNYKGSYALKLLKKLEDGESIFEKDARIEVVKVDNERKRKLDKLNGTPNFPINNLGTIRTEELYDFLKKEADKFLRSRNGQYYQNYVPEKTATPEEIDDFCLHMDNLKKQEEV